MESCKCFHDVIMQFFAQNSGNSLNRDPSKISKISRTNTGRGLIILLYFVLDQQFSLCEETLRSDILFKRLLKISIFHNRDIGEKSGNFLKYSQICLKRTCSKADTWLKRTNILAPAIFWSIPHRITSIKWTF